MVEQRLQIARERVVVIAARRLTGLAEAPTVIGDAAVSVREEHPLLPLPGWGCSRATALEQSHGSRVAGQCPALCPPSMCRISPVTKEARSRYRIPSTT